VRFDIEIWAWYGDCEVMKMVREIGVNVVRCRGRFDLRG
jgi:hypothetical protein